MSSTFDALYARSTLIPCCCYCCSFPRSCGMVFFCVLFMLAFGRWKMCKQQHARTLSLSRTANAFKQTFNNLCVCVRYVLPFAVLFSLCVSIFAFICPDEFIPVCNCVRCFVTSVSEFLYAYSLSFVCSLSLVSHSRSYTKFRFYTLNNFFLLLNENNKKKSAETDTAIGQENIHKNVAINKNKVNTIAKLAKYINTANVKFH